MEPVDNEKTQVVGYANQGFDDEDVPNNVSVGEVPNNVSVGEASSQQEGSDRKGNETDETRQMEMDDIEKIKAEKRERKPLKFIELICNRPKTFFALFLGGHLFSIILTMLLMTAGYEVLPLVFDSLPVDIRDNVDYLRGLAWDFKKQTSSDVITAGDEGQPVVPERSSTLDTMVFIFYSGTNLLTQESLLQMDEVEKSFYEDPDFNAKYCMLEEGSSTVCQKPSSILRFFDGTFSSFGAVFNDPTFSDVVGVINAAKNTPETATDLDRYLGKDSAISATSVYVTALRGFLDAGYPLEGYANTTESVAEQEGKWKDFLKITFLDKATSYYKNGIGDINFAFNSVYGTALFIEAQVFKDFALVVGSFTFIVIFMCIQTRSLWVTFCAIFSILTSFFATNIFYNIIFDIKYLGIFHVLAVFIILGIGADDVFVFYDTWIETKHVVYKSLAHRMSDCYRRASMAMLYTSLTTALAFFISGTAPFLAIYSFGIFSGTLVIINYISVITFFPCAVLVYHLYFEKFKCCCCCPRPEMEDEHASDAQTIPVEKKGYLVRFFAGPYYKVISHKVVRWVILVAFALLLALMMYSASNLKVNEEQIEFVSADTLLGKYLSLSSSKFQQSSQGGQQIYLVWGLHEQNRAGCHHSNASCFGETVWDEEFDLNSNIAQTDLKNFCDRILNLPAETIDKLKIEVNAFTNQPEIECFINEMNNFYSPGITLPISKDDAQAIMASKPAIYTEPLSSNLINSRYFEVSASYWLYNGFNLADPYKYMKQYNSLLGEGKLDGTKKVVLNGDLDFYYGTKLKFAAVIVNSKINSRQLGYPEGLKIRNDWEDWFNEQLNNMTDALKGGFQCTPEEASGFNLWAWLTVQKVLVKTAVLGLAIGIAVAAPILIIATKNIFTGLLATLIITIIVVSVVGVIPAAGWKLGFLESLNLVLVVGLSVDYVVHLAEGYSRSQFPDRLRRTRATLEEVGVSVISGAFTTLGSSLFLLPAKILFFTQFGLFMLSTVGFALLYSLGLFIVCLALFGPEGNKGSLKPVMKKIKDMCCSCCSKKDSVDITK